MPPRIPGKERTLSSELGQGQWEKWTTVATAMVIWSLISLALGMILLAGPGRILLLLAISGLPALAGTVLGLRSLLATRRATEIGRAGLALFALLTWPLLILDGAFLSGFMPFFLALFRSFRGPKLGFTLLTFGLLAALVLDAAIVWGVSR